mmetsp:Transcript_46945/g.121113  ORF Transcript_46945/g.121113 Transcript_46945/m.121113 type:complete len:485 (+) Transcript_46945:195-1649(+)
MESVSRRSTKRAPFLLFLSLVLIPSFLLLMLSALILPLDAQKDGREDVDKVNLLTQLDVARSQRSKDRDLQRKWTSENHSIESVSESEQRRNASVQGTSISLSDQTTLNGFPIAVITSDRASYLSETLNALLNVRGISLCDVAVVQDGTDPSVASVISNARMKFESAARSFRFHQIPSGSREPDGGRRIASHYRRTLNFMFQTYSDSRAVILLEDDLRPSPAIVEYFSHCERVLREDPTLMAVSAFNDNGLEHLVQNASRILRTEWFVGLGWLMTRDLFNEVGKKWPDNHWDHFLRHPSQRKGRAVLIPEVPLVYHFGRKGTFMDAWHHDRYMEHIQLYAGPSVDYTLSSLLVQQHYEKELQKDIRKAIFFDDVEAFRKNFLDKHYVYSMGMVFSCAVIPERRRPGHALGHHHDERCFRQVAEFFGIWHESGRSSYKGVHRFSTTGGNSMFVIASDSPFTPHERKIVSPSQMRGHTIRPFSVPP